ncbi:dTMP kinase [Periweissella ghanensis]|uniref:Thymidylate kinase n=1 Tax=Periweissella ghanensis TaxID=467997 RepID=A0ABM8ZDR6_9LACO|nr:dTMP kinase [Periweissella ghanensis]MCM0601813.1 dTMP kinase [Periweissella ghanensis]CAH0418800.1 Thymidylate kinase [Periweissella ghanensis]
MAGKFITFEGPDGAGKTSVLNEIIAKIAPKLGAQLVVTREPGGTHIAEAIRNVILDTENTDMDPRTEALLFAAARRQHITQIIQPALDTDKFVFCDRFVDSSVAYQGAGRKIGADEVWQMNKFATEGLMPNLTLYFDVPSEVGLTRIQNFRADEINRLDQASLSFHRRVREAYLTLQNKYPERIVLIDATQPFEAVVADAMQAITHQYPELNI